MADVTEADEFPLKVTTGDAVHDKARLVVREGRVYLFIESGGAVRLVASGDVESVQRHGVRTYTVTLDTGEVWLTQRGAGCGCGSKLKRMRTAELLTLAGVNA